jgi:hypothetical protein
MRVLVAVALAALASPAAGADTPPNFRQGEGWSSGDAVRWATHMRCSAERNVAPTVATSSVGSVASLIVVGFTGGAERRDSSISGVVRAGRAVASATRGDRGVTVLLYNNAEWPEAGRDVLALAQAHSGDGPLIVTYGHSLGAGSIGRFARSLGAQEIAIDLAVYIDAVTWRNPRVPSNVRRAVNFYQRTGLLRGLPLRGKSRLIPESPSATTLLGSYRLSPKTPRFGWHWNLVQPLFYRHHHRLAHDERIQQLLVSVAAPPLHDAGRDACASPATLALGDLHRSPPEL